MSDHHTRTPLLPTLIAFSRAILGGKKTRKLEARCSDELKEGVAMRFRALGFHSESEYLEYIATVDVFGIDHIRMVHDRRLAMVLASSDNGQAKGGSL